MIHLSIKKTCALAVTVLSFNAMAYGESVSYSVPVPDELKANATFQLTQAKIEKVKTSAGHDYHMRYQLPPELVGPQSAAIELSGSSTDEQTDPKFTVSGPLADATCEENLKKMTCRIHMKPGIANPTAAQSFIDQTVKEQLRHAQLSEIMWRFSGDPIGVIEYLD